MVTNLFTRSNPEQKAGLLTRLLGSAGPGALSGVFGESAEVTPQQANQIPPQAVQQLAQHAQNGNSGVVDEVAQFYAHHPQIVTALGGLALSIAIQHVARR